jgi:hypothetical protein
MYDKTVAADLQTRICTQGINSFCKRQDLPSMWGKGVQSWLWAVRQTGFFLLEFERHFLTLSQNIRRKPCEGMSDAKAFTEGQDWFME